MWILALRTMTIGDALIAAGTTIQVPDNFVLSEKVQPVAPPVQTVVAPVVTPPPVILNGTLRFRSRAQFAGRVQEAGEIFTLSAGQSEPSFGPRRGSEAMYDVFQNGQWQQGT